MTAACGKKGPPGMSFSNQKPSGMDEWPWRGVEARLERNSAILAVVEAHAAGLGLPPG